MMLRSKKAAQSSSISSTLHAQQQHEDDYRNDVDSSTIMETTTRGSSKNNGGNISIGSINISINSNGSSGGGNNSDNNNNSSSGEEISVSNLRKLYSSLLEELAPLHYELGTDNTVINNDSSTNGGDNTSINRSTNGDTKSGGGNNKNANYRWKNSGTITVDGTDDTGYDYYYTPDDTVQSWRLTGLASASRRDNIAAIGDNKGGGGSNNGRRNRINSKKYIEGGITGGDWSKDGIKRYYTGGNTTHTTPTAAVNGVKDGNGKNNDVFRNLPKEKGMVESNNDEGNHEEEPPPQQQQQQLDERFSIGEEDEGNEIDVLDDMDDDDVFRREMSYTT